MQYTSGSGDAFSGIPQIEEALKINEIAKKMDRDLTPSQFVKELENASDCMYSMYKSLRASSELYRDKPQTSKQLHKEMKNALGEFEKMKVVLGKAKELIEDNPNNQQLAMRLATDTKMRSTIMPSRMGGMTEIVPNLINKQFPPTEKAFRRAIMDNIAENIDTLRDSLVHNAPHVAKVIGTRSNLTPSIYHQSNEQKTFNKQFRDAWDYKAKSKVSIQQTEEDRGIRQKIKSYIGI